MEINEFSEEFDIYYNSITSNKAPGLDAYEKSVLLTRAQTEILVSYLTPKGNKYQEGFDGSQKRQIDFSQSITTAPYSIDDLGAPRYDSRENSVSCQLPDDILVILNERVSVRRNNSKNFTNLVVTPLQFNEYDRLMSKPFKRPLKNQAWRLISGKGSNQVDLIAGPNDEITFYMLRYVKRPTPIILEPLEDGLTIDGKYTPMGCTLDPILHREIVQRAAELAKSIYMGDLQSQLVLGQTSQTNIGTIPQSR